MSVFPVLCNSCMILNKEETNCCLCFLACTKIELNFFKAMKKKTKKNQAGILKRDVGVSSSVFKHCADHLAWKSCF